MSGEASNNMAKGNWPYRVQLAAQFAKANSDSISRFLAVEPTPKAHASRRHEGDVVLYSFALEDQAALFHWRFGGKRADAA